MTWDEALAALGTIEEWQAPADLGPLPVELAAHARHILEQLTEQIRVLEAQQAEIGRELAALPTAGAVAPSGPRYIDTTA
jgi:hypothetical protein